MSHLRLLIELEKDPQKVRLWVEGLNQEQLRNFIRELENTKKNGATEDSVRAALLIGRLKSILCPQSEKYPRLIPTLVKLGDAYEGELLEKSSNTKWLQERIEQLHAPLSMTEKLQLVCLGANMNLTVEQATELTYTSNNALHAKGVAQHVNTRMKYQTIKKCNQLEVFLEQLGGIDQATYRALEKNWEGSLEGLMNACQELGPQREKPEL